MVKRGKCHLDPNTLREIVGDSQLEHRELTEEEIDRYLKNDVNRHLKNEDNKCKK